MPAEVAALRGEADRLLTRYADDPTPLGRRCHALGARLRDGAADVRMLPYMWRAVDPAGNVGLVSGDAHVDPHREASPAGPAAGAGVVHLARGVDPLNPDRGLPALLETARHEFAHLVLYGEGVRQGLGWNFGDPAEALAAACGPAAPAVPGQAAGH